MRNRLKLVVLILLSIALLVVSSILAYREWGPTDQEAAVTENYHWKNAGANKINHLKTCDYFVAENGNNNNFGTVLNQPWKDINFATATAPAGKTICIKGGTYEVGYLQDQIRMTKGGQRLTNVNQDEVIIKGPGVSREYDPTYFPQIQITSSGNIIENLIIKDIPTRVIIIQNIGNKAAANNIVRNNTISNVGTGHVTVSDDDGRYSIAGNKFLHNIFEYANIGSDGREIYAGGKNRRQNGGQGIDSAVVTVKKTTKLSTQSPETAVTFSGNIMRHVTDHNFMIDPAIGEARGVIITNNYMQNAGIFLHATDDILVDGNTIVSSNETILRGACIQINAGEGAQVQDIINKYPTPEIGKQHALSENIRVTNNIMIGCNDSFRIQSGHPDAKLKDILIKGNTIVTTGNQNKPDACTERNCGAVKVLVGQNSTDTEIPRVVDYDQAFVNSRFEDNIIYKSGNENNSKVKIYLVTAFGQNAPIHRPPNGITFRNNLWSGSPGSGFTQDQVINPKLAGAPNGGALPNFDKNTPADTVVNMLKLTSSSPAVNAALDNTLTHDLLGNSRPVGARNDIGAIEFGGVAQTNTPTPIIVNTSVPSTTPTGTRTPSLTPTQTPRLSSVPSPTPLSGNVCGKADVNGDGRFTLVDFAEFAKAYGRGTNTCADKDVNYGACRGRDANKDGRLNIVDFGGETVGFAQRYFPKTSCALD